MHQNAQICMLQFKLFFWGHPRVGEGLRRPQTPSLGTPALRASLGASIVPQCLLAVDDSGYTNDLRPGKARTTPNIKYQYKYKYITAGSHKRFCKVYYTMHTFVGRERNRISLPAFPKLITLTVLFSTVPTSLSLNSTTGGTIRMSVSLVGILKMPLYYLIHQKSSPHVKIII